MTWLKLHWFRLTVVLLLAMVVVVLLAMYGSSVQTASPYQNATTTTFYIKSDQANFRSCPSTDCKIIGSYPKNTAVSFPISFGVSIAEIPEWLPTQGYSEEGGDYVYGYINKSNFSVKPVEEKAQTQTFIQAKAPETDSQITSSDLKPYLSGVVQIDCYGDDGGISGSGSVWNIPGRGPGIITNAHVTGRNILSGVNCRFWSYAKAFTVEVSQPTTFNWNNEVDVAAHKISSDTSVVPETRGDVSDLNYSISKMTLCSTDISIGTPVVIVGYPAFGSRVIEVPDYGESTYSSQITTNGIVSGTDISPRVKNLPYNDYFVSAKIDSGNSGGVAFAKVDGKMCLLGIPTWLNVGNYETQGLVQNIHNVFYRP